VHLNQLHAGAPLTLIVQRTDEARVYADVSQ
jgi:hypothetical protein